MRTLVVPVLILASSLVGTATADDKAAADLKTMVGKWDIQKAELGGLDITEQLKVLKFEITEGGKYTAQLGDEKDVGAFTVDPSKKLKEMDIKGNGGPNKDKLIKAIYKLDGDAMTICYELGGDGKVRPTAFESKADSKLLLVSYKRKK